MTTARHVARELSTWSCTFLQLPLHVGSRMGISRLLSCSHVLA